MLSKVILFGFLQLTLTYAEVEIEHFPAQPYAFGYAAGRFPGHIDRTHSEVSDGAGVVQGSYSYVDPNFQIHKVDYIADSNGFHPILNKEISAVPKDTPVVAAAKMKHLRQYAKIAEAHQHPEIQLPIDTKSVQNAKSKHLNLFEKIAEEHARIAAERAILKAQVEAENPNSLEEHNNNY